MYLFIHLSICVCVHVIYFMQMCNCGETGAALLGASSMMQSLGDLLLPQKRKGRRVGSLNMN